MSSKGIQCVKSWKEWSWGLRVSLLHVMCGGWDESHIERGVVLLTLDVKTDCSGVGGTLGMSDEDCGIGSCGDLVDHGSHTEISVTYVFSIKTVLDKFWHESVFMRGDTSYNDHQVVTLTRQQRMEGRRVWVWGKRGVVFCYNSGQRLTVKTGISIGCDIGLDGSVRGQDYNSVFSLERLYCKMIGYTTDTVYRKCLLVRRWWDTDWQYRSITLGTELIGAGDTESSRVRSGLFYGHAIGLSSDGIVDCGGSRRVNIAVFLKNSSMEVHVFHHIEIEKMDSGEVNCVWGLRERVSRRWLGSWGGGHAFCLEGEHTCAIVARMISSSSRASMVVSAVDTVWLDITSLALEQFCDGDLEVFSFPIHVTVRNLEGDDLINRRTADSNVVYYLTISDSELLLHPYSHVHKQHLQSHGYGTEDFHILNWYHKHLTNLKLGYRQPKFKYGKDHLCSACERGKSKKASHPPKLVPNDHSKLELLYMAFMRSKE
ncbi:hypothetical protein Tco_0599161 [Tanacetum coccineum]